MKTTKTANVNKQATDQKDTAEILVQKLGDRWFAFSLIEDEIFMGSISQDEIDSREQNPS